MKTFKLAIFSLAMALVAFTSCTNNESVIEDQQNTEESESITSALNQLSVQFDQNGNLTQTDNPAGNIVFDFCFDFVYPLDLSYNNDTTVTVNDLDNLIDVMLSSTEDLYINGIAFPFNVETFNEDTNAIGVETINNEEEFIALLDSCEFDDIETCECTEEFAPVCVEVSDPNGGIFTITYPNACYAECDGFTEDDFLESCEEDYNPGGGIECFTLNYPLSIIVDSETTITINSEEEFSNALYDVYHFDFVYPFTVTLDDESVVTINSPEDIEAILIDCFGNFGSDCGECDNEPTDPVCAEITNPNGETEVVTFPNLCIALCFGLTQDDIIECD